MPIQPQIPEQRIGIGTEAQLGLSLKQNLVMMVTLVARSVLVNTMAALCASLALLTGAKAEPNNYGRGGGGRGQARAGPWHGGGGEQIQ